MTSQPHLTRHASVRSQQRGIPPLIMDWLIHYGTRQPARDGASILFFDKASRRRLAQDVGSTVLQALDPMLYAYIVQAADDAVITLGWRTKRVMRDLKSTSKKPAALPSRNRH